MQWPGFIWKVLGTETLSGEEKRVLLAMSARIAPEKKGELTQTEIGDHLGWRSSRNRC